jgi:co-chaperonin GroES (HSP10)
MRKPVLSSVETDPASIQPLGDLVLVKRLPDSEKTPSGMIWLPNTRNEKNPAQGPRRGVVVAVGPGDRELLLWCGNDKWVRDRSSGFCEGDLRPTFAYVLANGIPACPQCGGSMYIVAGANTVPHDKLHRPMHVEVGDEVIYNRAPANDVSINGEEYVFIHEEQHLLAVIEKGAA